MTRWWNPPPVWEGETVFIVGGGPSLIPILSDLSNLLTGRRVIGVNQAYELGSVVDICWFGDYRWFRHNMKDLAEFHGIVAGCASEFTANKNKPYWVFAMRRGKPQGIEEKPGMVSWNSNSGASAINAAYHLGAKKIVLLGFDMKRTEGAPTDGHNWHGKHARFHVPRKDIYEVRHLKCWPKIAKDAEKLGVYIVNTSLNSAIEVFEKISLEKVLGDGTK